MARETTARRTRAAVELREAVAPALEEGADLPALFRVVQDRLPKALGLEAGAVWVRDADRRRFVGPADFGLDAHGPLSFREELPLRAQSLAEPVWVADRTASGETPMSSLFDARAKAFLIVPIAEDGRLLAIGAFASASPGSGMEPLDRAREAAALLSPAIRRGVTQLGLQEDFKLHQQLLDLVRQLSGDISLASFLQRVFWIVEKLMPVDAMFVATRRPDGMFDALLETDLDAE